MISLKNITKTYTVGAQFFSVLKGVSFDIQDGEFTAIMGQSGSGKSTLMNIIGLLDTPTKGTYTLAGIQTDNLSDDEQADIRSRKIGFVFQQYNLLARMPAIKQVAVPLMYQGISRSERLRLAAEALKAVGLEDKMYNKPNELSGGQQQRVAIARAIVANPAILLADEPTGALDSETGQEVMEIFKKLNNEGKTIIIVTHAAEIAAQTKRTIKIKDGLISE